MDTVIPVRTNWHKDLQEWLQPFLAVFKRSEQHCCAPIYLQGLLDQARARASNPWPNGYAPDRCASKESTCIGLLTAVADLTLVGNVT